MSNKQKKYYLTIMRIEDLTKQLKYRVKEFSNYPHVRFNPCILHIKKDMYYICYRLFIPYFKLKNDENPITWKARWYSNIDTTILAEFKYSNGKFTLLNEHELIPKYMENKNQTIVDSRLVKDKNDNTFLTFNTWTQDTKTDVHKGMKDCLNSYNCTYIAKSKLNMKSKKLYKFNYPCLNLEMVMPKSSRCFEGQREEKNWVWWYDENNKENISYFVEPHIVFQNKPFGKCKIVANTTTGNLKKISNKYPGLKFLLGTPPIPYNDTEYIAVGHAKYNYKKVNILEKSTLKNKILHVNKSCSTNPSNFIYMMYFYTFSKKAPYNITRVSHAFIPKNHGKYLLTFPMGITRVDDDNKFVVSYGEGDKYVKLMHITRSSIEKIMNDYATLSNEKYKFLVY